MKPSSYLNVAKNRSDFLNVVFTELENIKTSSSALLFLIQSIFLMIGYMAVLLFNIKLFFINSIYNYFIYFFFFSLTRKFKKIHAIQILISKNKPSFHLYSARY